MSDTLNGKSLLITGGSGAFGQAFARRCLQAGARQVSIFSRGEAAQAKMRATLSDPRVIFRLGDVRDHERLTQCLRDIDFVVHAGAQKRVESCTADPTEALLTNTIGTLNVARACAATGVAKACYLSTDKASAPNTAYGTFKRAGEHLWLEEAWGGPMLYTVTRYGNVLGSTGSVVPIWRELAAQGKPIPISDPSMTRFWMRMDDAVDLVVLALTNTMGGDIFVPKIGGSTIATLAEAIVPNSPRSPIGLRAGEKFHESLISAEESRTTVDAGSHYVIRPDNGYLRSRLVPEGFEYRSDTARQLSVAELREMIA